MTSYVWVGFLVIATLTVLAVVAAQALRKQMRLARLKTDLVAAVSHELKTPLSGMRLLVDALLEDQQFDPRKTREYLELIARENLRLSRLIDNFLTFSRMERNRHKFEFKTTTAAEVVEAVREALADRFHAPGVHLVMDVASALPALHADPDALVTVLLNLLDNAYKFTPEEKRLTLRACESGGRIAFSVADNGIGIPPRERKRIFRRFYQVDRHLSRSVGGCGLGLSIVEFIARAHGGEVRVESSPGRGSTFTVLLPAAAAREAAA
jgi:signal transduction histidine kinase